MICLRTFSKEEFQQHHIYYINKQCLADISRDYILQFLAEEVGVWQFWFPHTSVGTRLRFPDDRTTGVSYCRLLLSDTMLKDDSFRTGTSDSPICDCGIELETTDHFLLRCSWYSEARTVMKNYIWNVFFWQQETSPEINWQCSSGTCMGQ